MNITFQKISPVEGTFIVELPAADYASRAEHLIRNYNQKVSLNGFRKGHAPHSLIKRLYGGKILHDLVIETASEAVKSYIKEHHLAMWAEPLLIENTLTDTPNSTYAELVTVKFSCAFVPDLDFSNLAEINQEGFSIKGVSEATLDTWIRDMQTSHATMGPSHSSDQATDILCGTLTGEAKFKERFCLSAHTQLGQDNPSFLGLQPGHSITAQLSPDASYNLPDAYVREVDSNTYDKTIHLLKELKGTYQFTVEEIHRPILPPLDQAFFKKVFPEHQIDSLAQFKETLTPLVIQHMQKVADRLLLYEVKEAVLQHLHIMVPTHFLKMKTAASYAIRKEELADSLQKSNEHSFRWNIIQTKIAQENHLKITNSELLTYLAEQPQARLEELTTQAHMISALQDHAYSPGRMEYNLAYQALLEAKVLHILKTKINIQQVEKTVEEFSSILSHKKGQYPDFAISPDSL